MEWSAAGTTAGLGSLVIFVILITISIFVLIFNWLVLCTERLLDHHSDTDHEMIEGNPR